MLKALIDSLEKKPLTPWNLETFAERSEAYFILTETEFNCIKLMTESEIIIKVGKNKTH